MKLSVLRGLFDGLGIPESMWCAMAPLVADDPKWVGDRLRVYLEANELERQDILDFFGSNAQDMIYKALVKQGLVEEGADEEVCSDLPPLQRIRAEQAFRWTCPECHRENFDRAHDVKVDDLTEEERQGFGYEPWEDVDLVKIPDTVTCRDCLHMVELTCGH